MKTESIATDGGVPCSMDNSLLFMRARELADHMGRKDESKWYQEQEVA